MARSGSGVWYRSSKRYVKFKGEIPVVKPATVADNAETSALFDEAIECVTGA